MNTQKAKTRKCLECDSYFTIPKERPKQKFCNRSCANANITRRRHASGDMRGAIEAARKANLGAKRTPEQIARMFAHRKPVVYTPELRAKLSASRPKGKNHWRWVEDRKYLMDKALIRNSFEYKEWHRKVLERDWFTCQQCGYKGKKLNVHHIELFISTPDKRFDVDNGLTLCVDCHRHHHKTTDHYGRWPQANKGAI